MKYFPGNIKERTTDVKKTDGKEYMFVDGTEYIGYYHIKGETLFSGAVHDTFSQVLIDYNPDKNYVKYINLTDSFLLGIYTDPSVYLPILTDKDYEKGYLTRYFIKQRNNKNARIIEIDKKQYDSLNTKDKGINERFYMGMELDWKVVGPIYDGFKNNEIYIYGVADTNNRTLTLKEDEMSNIKNNLQDLLQFARIK